LTGTFFFVELVESFARLAFDVGVASSHAKPHDSAKRFVDYLKKLSADGIRWILYLDDVGKDLGSSSLLKKVCSLVTPSISEYTLMPSQSTLALPLMPVTSQSNLALPVAPVIGPPSDISSGRVLCTSRYDAVDCKLESSSLRLVHVSTQLGKDHARSLFLDRVTFWNSELSNELSKKLPKVVDGSFNLYYLYPI
jgi:hypothetical protein